MGRNKRISGLTRVAVKYIYLEPKYYTKLKKISEHVVASDRELLVQSVRSVLVYQREHYLSYAKSEAIALGLSWSDYAALLNTDDYLGEAVLEYRPSSLSEIPEQTKDGIRVQVNEILLPEQSAFILKIIARKERLKMSQVISRMVVWHIDTFWESRYRRIVENKFTDDSFIEDIPRWD